MAVRRSYAGVLRGTCFERRYVRRCIEHGDWDHLGLYSAKLYRF